MNKHGGGAGKTSGEKRGRATHQLSHKHLLVKHAERGDVLEEDSTILRTKFLRIRLVVVCGGDRKIVSFEKSQNRRVVFTQTEQI